MLHLPEVNLQRAMDPYVDPQRVHTSWASLWVLRTYLFQYTTLNIVFSVTNSILSCSILIVEPPEQCHQH